MEFIDIFLKYEEERNLFNEEIYGVRYWHYIRYILFQKMLREKTNSGDFNNISRSLSKKEKFIEKLEQVYNIILKNPLIGLKNKEVLVLNSSRRSKNGDVYECIYTDDLIKSIDNDYYVLENNYMGKHFKPAITQNLLYMDYISLKRSIIKKLWRRKEKYKISSEDENRIKIILKDLENLLEVKIDEAFVFLQLEEIIYSYKSTYKDFEKILETVKPKAIIEVCHYEFDKLLMNEVAQKKNIKVIELQHGTIDKYHLAYNFQSKRDLITYPNYIFTFGEYWSKISRFPIGKNHLIDVGFYNYEKKKDKYKETLVDNNKNILFISQNTIGKELSTLAVELKEELQDRYNILYKLHPKEVGVWKSDYPWLVNSGIQVIDNNDKDLYYYFSISEAQIGVYSTAMFEGIGFGLKTFIYKTFGHEYMQNLYNNNYAKLIENTQEISEGLGSCFSKSNEVEDKLWKKHSIDNFKKALNIILKNKD